jgi:phosphoenolpyruvate-protein phosphotransferase
MEAMGNETFAARAVDMRDAGRRVLRLLLGQPEEDLSQLKAPMVILARDLAPSDTVRLDKALVLAFCTAEGGPTSHTAILAKALGIPAVVGLGKELLALKAGEFLLVDGARGEVLVEPDEAAIIGFQARERAHLARAEVELASAQEPAVTRDGHAVEVVANIGSEAEAKAALVYGAKGVGLLRTEFLYLDRKTAPGEEEQHQAYAAILEVMGTRPVVSRTLDVGGDKPLAYLDLGQEANPFLGWRAIRMCLDKPDFFKIQLRALLRASPQHDLRIMFPMVATLEEVRQAKALLAEARRELEAEGAPLAEQVQVGIMVEIPSVVVLADQFAREVDFFSVGTNDLTQYTFAAERTNEKVAHLGDACHPAILRQIGRVIQAAHAAGIWAGVCGELAGDPEAVPILLGLGLDEFSMAPASIPGAKAILRQWSQEEAQRLAESALALESAEAVREMVRSNDPLAKASVGRLKYNG